MVFPTHLGNAPVTFLLASAADGFPLRGKTASQNRAGGQVDSMCSHGSRDYFISSCCSVLTDELERVIKSGDVVFNLCHSCLVMLVFNRRVKRVNVALYDQITA